MGSRKTYVAQQLKPRACEQCTTPFTPRRHWQKFCSQTCREGRWADERAAAINAYRAKKKTADATGSEFTDSSDSKTE